jgi:hemerythrin-like domain-containing protein
MRPTETLKGEHRVIEQVLLCLERIADRCAARETLDVISALRVLDFLRHFAEGCHQEKEERLLFPRLEARGFPHDFGPTEIMREEHARGRRYLHAMAASVEGAGAGDPDAVEQFIANAWAYVCLMRDHIHKEDYYLFPIADRCLSRADQRELLESFAELEAERGEGMAEHFLAEAAELAARWDVPRARVGAGFEHVGGV